MDKNITKIIDKDGNKLDCEIILKYYDEKNNKNYLVYKIDDEYFATKFQDVLGCAALDTKLTETEINDLKSLINNRRKGLNYEIIN